ncbi:cytochrome c peroxidase [Campylobacter pinnipediorum subsp. caledonicus]|uniref:cytochrome-c peroxidase n=1 Tax=Campylobacter pinnipediorum TaxID=1965231 RepID=UPI000994F01C|nr:cytochrome c peroxidase [Campylobacter pinnipediorum]AQW86821.1 cytochrome c peroxidase [Campylobacter pinnipediorum subsp. caledonicus]
MKKILGLFFFVGLLYADIFAPSLGILYNEAKANLGKKIFFDNRLGANENKSCETCHNLYWDFSGTIRTNLQNNKINPPSILNAALNYIFFRNGDHRNIYDQVLKSVTSKHELGVDKNEIITKISNVNEYRIAFLKIYEDGVTFENIVDVLVEFERAVLSVNSPFDRFLMGDSNALSEEEKIGFELFKNIGCVACHNGINLGGNLMQNIGAYEEIFSNMDSSRIFKEQIYKVPSLRNIARTAPYMSDGSILYLKDAIIHIVNLQSIHNIDKKDVDLLYKFLLSLNGEYPRILK